MLALQCEDIVPLALLLCRKKDRRALTPILQTSRRGCTGAMIDSLITKTDTNPFFVKMKEGATAKAAELGVDLKAYAGKDDGDNEGQVAAVETCIADGAKGILITPSEPKMVRTITRKKGRDRVLFFSCGLVFPVPHLLQKVFHIHLFGFHLDHPRMLEHPPWCRSSGWVFLEAVKKEILSAKHGRSDEI